jgi:hypothetical protein
MKTKILRTIFLSVGTVVALARLLAAGTSDDVLNLNMLLDHSHPTFITFDPPGSTSTLPSAIIATRMIIGSYVDESGVTHGFLRKRGGSFTTFDVPGSSSTTPTDVTSSGVITGWYSDQVGNPHGFIRARDGSITSFNAPPGYNILGSIYFPGGPPPSINPAGTIAGSYASPFPNFVEHGFLRTADGCFTTIDYPGATFTEALAINPAGVIVGDFCNDVTCYQGFLRTPDGTFTMINANAGIPAAINSAGAITGSVLTEVGGYVRNPDGTFITFNPPDSISTAPFAINSAGVITGYYCDGVGCHGFLRSPRGTITTFDPPGSTFTVATAINPRGVITGAYFDAGGLAHGFVRIP